MGWAGRLALDYEFDGDKTRSHSRHHGPMRVLASLYPEGPAVCHHVLVHPPGGMVSGDLLQLELKLGAGSHAVLTTPGATRFYRSSGEAARQQIKANIGAGARLEWLPMETICHRSTRAENSLKFKLESGAEMIGWDMMALGLPASGEKFDHGNIHQEIELPGIWLERCHIDGGDRRLLDSGTGWAGKTVLASLWFACADPVKPDLRQTLLDLARERTAQSALADCAGTSSPDARLVVLRVLAQRVEPAMNLLSEVRKSWREAAWGLAAHPPRIWRT